LICRPAALPPCRPSGTSLYSPPFAGRMRIDSCSCSTGPLARSRNPDARACEKKRGAVPNAGNCRPSSSSLPSPLASRPPSRVHDAATRHPALIQQLPQRSFAFIAADPKLAPSILWHLALPLRCTIITHSRTVPRKSAGYIPSFFLPSTLTVLDTHTLLFTTPGSPRTGLAPNTQ
jgi:hypothetical protein